MTTTKPATPTGLHTNPDARAWAAHFSACLKYRPAIAQDEDCMATWFANAMMAALDFEYGRSGATAEMKAATPSITDVAPLLAEIRKWSRRCGRLEAVAQAVVDRWDTPLWKNVPATGEFINRLRAVLREGEE